jgi:lambda repressor-like predicted transcriptional regulator
MTLQAELIFALEDQKQAVGHCRLFARLLKVVERHPNTWAAVRWKLLHPEWSYSDIAKAMKCDKQLVAYHLGEAKRVMPEITHGLLIDHRHHPDKQEEKRARQRSLTGAPNLKIEISFRKLAKKVGVSESSIRRYMSGSVPNKTEIAERLGQVLNIDPRTIWPEAFDDLPDERRSL